MPEEYALFVLTFAGSAPMSATNSTAKFVSSVQKNAAGVQTAVLKWLHNLKNKTHIPDRNRGYVFYSFLIRVKKVFLPLLPLFLYLRVCQIPVWPAFYGNGTKILPELIRC